MRRDINSFVLTSEFQRSAAKYVEAFPLLENIAVLSPYDVIYSTPKTKTAFTENPRETKQALHYVKAYFERRHLAHAFTNIGYQLTRNNILNFVSMPLREFYNQSAHPFPRDYKKFEMQTIHDFDHEFGHLISDQPYKHPGHSGEAFADAFAALMHIKRYGRKDNFLEERAKMRSNFVISAVNRNVPQYYTSYAICGAMELSKRVDIEKAPLQDIDWYAREIVYTCNIQQDDLQKVVKAYSKTNSLEDVVEVMLAHKDDDHIYRAGKLYVGFQLDNPQVLDCSLTEKSAEVFWPRAAAEMEAFEDKTNFILNPVKSVTIKRADQVLSVIPKKQITEKMRESIESEVSPISHLIKVRNFENWAATMSM